MIYFGMGKIYEERQEYAQKQYGFKCDYLNLNWKIIPNPH